tara:strand:+ start:20044 stop:21609 length:1566 start_codon:yes stop_codon:yes gene_type:complete
VKKYSNNTCLHQSIVKGVNKLADNVATTLGPKGRNVIIKYKNNIPFVTKDGVTVAKAIVLDDAFENAAAEIIKQASLQTNSEAGDGTTTSTVLARAIINQAQAYITAGVSPVELKRGMDKATVQIMNALSDMSSPIRSVEDIKHIATISANNDAVIGDLVSRAVDLAGKDGSVVIEEGRSNKTSLDVIEGFRIDSGYAAGAFVTDERRAMCYYEKPLILVTDERLETVEEMIPILEQVARDGRPFVIVADDIVDQALAALIMNAVRGTMKIVAVKAPKYGEERKSILKDLAISVGATYVSRESGVTLDKVTLKDLGSAKSVEIAKGNSCFVGGKGDYEEIERRIEAAKEQLRNTDSPHEGERIQSRITRLASGVSVIRVGGSTVVEMTETKHRVEDALEAVKAAQKEGVVAGGGIALMNAVSNLTVETENQDQDRGVEIITKACEAPIRQMARNCGKSEDIIIDMLSKDPTIGFDFRNDRIVNMVDSGIIDPVKVTRCALKNAVSAAGTLLTTNYAVIEIE